MNPNSTDDTAIDAPSLAVASAGLQQRIPTRLRPLAKLVRQTQVGFGRYLVYLVGYVPSHTFRNAAYRWIFGLSLGHKSSIHFRARFYHPAGVRIGDNTSIGNDAMLDGRYGIDIGDRVNFGGEVAVFTAQHDPQSPTFETVGGPVKIADFVYVGTRVTILPNVTIGEGAVVATGAVVTHDVAEYTIVGGVPAREIGQRRRDLSVMESGFRMPFQ